MWMIALLTALIGCNGKDSPASDDTEVTFDGDSCLACHGKIEQAHPVVDGIAAGDCVVCHGGDGASVDKDVAHVPEPDDLPGYYKGLAPDQLDAVDPDYVRFMNPGDIRAADLSCGAAGCHPDKVAGQKNSVMTTNTGHYMPTRYYAGMQGPDAIYGSHPAVDPDCDLSIPGTVCELSTLPPDGDEAIQAALEDGDIDALEAIAYNHYLAKNCNTCHASGYGKTDASYAYRSTGCSSCHVLYNKDGVYEGDDESIQRGFPVHAARHELTTAITVEQCSTCHFQGGRIGLNFRGIRESGFSEDYDAIQPICDTAADPECDDEPYCDPAVMTCKEPWNESAYDHTAGYYILDEDVSNEVDETPPDAHYQKGMVCADCHVGTDVHGDGRIYSTSKYQVDITCQDCHGDVREAAAPDEDGVFRTARGRALPQLSLSDDGKVQLTGVMDGALHTVPQPADYFAGGYASPDMAAAMGVDAHGWSHVDSLECDSCHNGYQLFCVGCHVSYDLRVDSKDQQTGEVSTGLATGGRTTYTLDHLLLGQGVSGKVQPINPSQHVQMSILDFDPDDPDRAILHLGEWKDEEHSGFLGAFRRNEVTDAQAGFAPFFQHTTNRVGRSCEDCHRQDDSADELARVRGVYGYGTGEFLLDNPYGDPVDPLQFIDDAGELTSLFVHAGTGPLAPEVRERALGVILDQVEGEK